MKGLTRSNRDGAGALQTVSGGRKSGLKKMFSDVPLSHESVHQNTGTAKALDLDVSLRLEPVAEDVEDTPYQMEGIVEADENMAEKSVGKTN